MIFYKKQPAPIPQQPAAPTLSPQQQIPFFATSIGASIDAFYRSAMNSLLNARLTNNKQGALFPNMHIQLPVRVMYLNGIKNLRVYIDHHKQSLLKAGSDKRLTELGLACIPGLAMTPFSSILEASNAGHMNPEPMATRWIRGLVPRAAREIIFAIGLNQVSDICQENVPAQVENKQLRNALGSLAAGTMAGYLSHVPHNLSTLKLLRPNVSYGQHFSGLVEKTVESRLNKQGFVYNSPFMRSVFGLSSVFLFPTGVQIRTLQIVGSFVIVNGMISLLNEYKLEENFRTAVYGQKQIKA